MEIIHLSLLWQDAKIDKSVNEYILDYSKDTMSTEKGKEEDIKQKKEEEKPKKLRKSILPE